MGKVTSIPSGQQLNDPLTELIREGARKLITQALELEVEQLLAKFEDQTVEGKKAVIRNGYLPERKIQTGVGDVPVRVPKVRDRSKGGVKFRSSIVPPYLRRTKSIEELLPVLYLKGISTGDFQDALAALFGPGASGLSPASISRLKKSWEDELSVWSKRDLSQKHYVYLWADGVYFNIRSDNDRECVLVIIGATEEGRKEVIAIEDGYRESEQSWTEVLQDLRHRGLTRQPKLAVGDGALGFWKAINKVFPKTRHQRCWVHKTANVLSKVPKSVQPKIKDALHQIWMAETRKEAKAAFKSTLARFSGKYPKAMECIEKDRDELLAFYDFPAEHWVHLRTTNPIESTFATVRLRTDKTRNCVSRTTILCMVFKLIQSAEKRWRRLTGHAQLAKVITGVRFIDGVPEDNTEKDQSKNAA